MRMYLVVAFPGGPCALDVKTAAGEVSTETTPSTQTGTVKSAERFTTSVSLSDIAFEVVRECIAQWLQGPLGSPELIAFVFGGGLGSVSSESICMSPMS